MSAETKPDTDQAKRVATTATRSTSPVISRVQCIGAIAWPSFFTAGVMTMVFFSIVDPELLRDITFPALIVSRKLGYTLGFFMFWLAAASSSLFTWILLRRPVSHSHFERDLPE